MYLNNSNQKKLCYVKPQLEEINLLDESASGWSEPPPPMPENPGGSGDEPSSLERGIDDALGFG